MTLRLVVVLGALLLASGASAANPVAAIVAHRGTTDVSNNATPFSVFFDAQTTTQAGKSTAEVYKELHFRWTFGDPNAGTWATGNQQGDAVRRQNDSDKRPLSLRDDSWFCSRPRLRLGSLSFAVAA